MKKHLFRLLLAIVPFTCFAQTKTVTVTLPPELADKAWVKFYVDSVRKVEGVVVPPVIVADCKAGPEIRQISNVTSKTANVQFHGEDVRSIEYELRRDGAGMVTIDSVRPESNIVQIKFPAQSDGTFNLIFRGKSCKSADFKAQFSIKTNSGSATNPVPDPVGGFTLKNLTQGMPEHLTLKIKEADGVRLISDVGSEDRGDRYSYRYMINAHILTQKDKLTNYPVAGNNPLRVLKFKLKDGLESINQWGTAQEAQGGYYQQDAGELFSLNTSFAFNTFVSTGPQSQAGFLNHVPQSYDPGNQVISWADIAPDMQLPAGHIWIGDWHGWTADHVYKKGVTHLPHHQLPWNEADGHQYAISLKNAGKTYNNVPRNEAIFGLTKQGANDYSNGWNRAWWPNGPLDPETARTKADQADISDAIWIGETMENESWLPANLDMWHHFYKRLRERYEDRFGKRGIPYQIVHNYFFLWPRDISLNREKPADYYRKLLVTKPQDLPKTPYSPGGTLANTTMITEAMYLGAPDIQTGVLYETIFRFELNKNMGYESGIFLAGQHEYRPNNKYQFRYPEGLFYTDKKIPLDPNVHIAAGFIAQVYGKLFIEWGASGKKDHKRHSYEWAKGWWYPNGATSPKDDFPYYSYTNDYYVGFDGGADLSYFSQKLYNDTFGQTDGGQRQYLRHRIDGGQWITPNQANAQEIVSAYFDKRGFAYSQQKDGKTAWFYLNSYADNNWHTLEVQLPGGEIKAFKVAGNGIHARLEK